MSANPIILLSCFLLLPVTTPAVHLIENQEHLYVGPGDRIPGAGQWYS